MKKFSVALLALATAIAISPAAKADTWPFTSSQQWEENGVTFNNLELFITTPGVYFADANWDNTSGWTGNLVNSQYVLLSGPDVTSLDFYTDFESMNPINTVTFDFYATEGTTVVDEALAIGPSGGWSVGALDPATFASQDTTPGPPASPTPEPSSLLFLGTGLLGLAGMLRRKLHA